MLAYFFGVKTVTQAIAVFLKMPHVLFCLSITLWEKQPMITEGTEQTEGTEGSEQTTVTCK